MRIWVTGIGVVSPLGLDATTTFERLLRGERAQRKVTLFDTAGCRSDIAAEVPDFCVADVAGRATVEWSRTDAMALCAAREALRQARLGSEGVDLTVGGTTAGMFETEALLGRLHREPAAREPVARMLSHPLSATVDRLSEALGPFRRARTLCSACSSGASAIMLAAAWLAGGQSERVLCGGADGLCRLTYVGFGALGALSAEPCRPFDARRDGLNLGEGAAFLVLEREDAAARRGVEPIVELRGWALGAEAHHITNPEASGATAAAVMSTAIARAGLEPGDVGYVNAHGTATRLNDSMECAAIRECFGDPAAVAVSSSKGQIGHTLGAAGAIEAAITALAVARHSLPPTVGLEQVDEACRLDHVLRARPAPVRAALSSSFGFGGSDAALLFAEPGMDPAPSPRPARPVYVAAAATAGPLGVLGTAASRGYLEPGAEARGGPAPFNAAEHLDPARARRIDRAGRMVAAVARLALAESGAGEQLAAAGAIVGGAFGAVDACAEFTHRAFDKGPRFASPAVFPNLLPSSPVAHASIYLGLGGPVFSCHDLAATSEAALVTAAELVAAAEVDWMVAGGVEQHSVITEQVLAPLCGGGEVRGQRGEGCAVLVLCATPVADPAARLAWWTSWRGKLDAGRLDGLASPATPGRALVVAGHGGELGALFGSSGWALATLRRTAARSGSHEAAGGVATAAAVSELMRGSADEALVIGLAPDRGYALHLVKP